MRVCRLCFTSYPTLDQWFKKNGKPGRCDCCAKRRKRVADAWELSDLFAGLTKRYQPARQGETYYRVRDEDDTIEGGDTGDPLAYLLQDDWPIFRDGMDSDTIDQILNHVWPEFASDELYAREALWDRHPSQEWESIKEHVKHERRFIPDDDQFDFTTLPALLKPYLKELTTEGKNEVWVRARIQATHDKALSKKQMGHPPKERASAGRANPAGISFLYLASDPVTACAEVRAEPGHAVTIAQFKINGPLKVLDVANALKPLDPFAHDDVRAEQQRRELVQAFADDLSRPVLAEDAPISYVPTQYLSEYFRSEGFDAIRYNSSVAEGTNLVLFKPEKATLVKKGSVLVTAKTLTVQPSKKLRPFTWKPPK